MPKLSALGRNRTVAVSYNGSTVQVIYNPAVINPEYQRESLKKRDELEWDEFLADDLSRLIVSWDLTDEDDKMFPVTKESLLTLPTMFTGSVSVAIYSDLSELSPKVPTARS